MISIDPNKIQVDWTKVQRTLPLTNSHPPMPPVKPPKKNKIERIYENDDFIIDLFVDEKMVRVSIFDGGHYKDEVMVRKDDYCG